jgi:serine O-acetyltransferase
MLPLEKRIRNKKDLSAFLAADLRYYEKVKRIVYFLQCGEAAILMRHQVLLRKTEYYVNTNRRIRALLYRFKLLKFQDKYAIHIPINCCGKGLRLMHVGPRLINGTACIGENCVFHINTAVVAGGTSNDAPVLGDSVLLGVGAVVLGGVTIVDSVAIGANAVVNKDILEPDIAVGGVPARKISNNGATAWGNNK